MIRTTDANCYLVETNAGFVLIDTGYPTTRVELTEALDTAGCKPGSLKLVVVTHGDIDHAGCCAYLQRAYNAKIAMHPGDADLVESGQESDKTCPSLLVKMVLWFAALSHRDVSMADFETFKPDVFVEEGTDFSEYGFGARVLPTPGHTKGSISILTAEGDLFSGDTLMNVKKGFLLSGWAEDDDQLRASVERLMAMEVGAVYPGHLKPFPMEVFLTRNR
jgi:glyoxylase-like metal-dependent hydrolase (beta-lactamase superfamily II)